MNPALPTQLTRAISRIYRPAGLKITKDPYREKEGEKYQACRFEINGRHVVFRVAKTTPKKVGQFVTAWKRPDAEIVPLHAGDGVDFFVISCTDRDSGPESRQGQFILDCDTLLQKRIMSSDTHGGKLSFRVYPPWCNPTNSTAKNTQTWQQEYFIEFRKDGTVDTHKLSELFGN